MGRSNFKDAVKALKEMFTTKEFMANMAQLPLAYALNGASVLAAAMHGHGAATQARFRWMEKQDLFRKPLREALGSSADRIPTSTVVATTPEELVNLSNRYGFYPGPMGLSSKESWMIHTDRQRPDYSRYPNFLRRQLENNANRVIKTDLVNVPQDEKGTVNVPVLRHELGHVKDFGEGKAQKDDQQAPIKNLLDWFTGIVNPDNTGLGRMEVRAWDNADIPAGHPMRESALDTYRHLHRYRLAKLLTQLF